MYYIQDTSDNIFWKWPFRTKSEALAYCLVMGRPDWKVIKK